MTTYPVMALWPVETAQVAHVPHPPSEWPKLLLAKHRALRSAAEQLGELEPRQINVGTKVVYEIGVDLEKL